MDEPDVSNNDNSLKIHSHGHKIYVLPLALQSLPPPRVPCDEVHMDENGCEKLFVVLLLRWAELLAVEGVRSTGESCNSSKSESIDSVSFLCADKAEIFWF